MKNFLKLKKLPLFFSIFIVLGVFIPLMNATPVSAAVTGEFIDAHFIKINRDGNEIIFRDVNPYDEDHGYRGGPESCRHDFDVNNYTNGEVSIQFKKVDSLGDCKDDGNRVNINLSGDDLRDINAYRKSDDLIFTTVDLNISDPEKLDECAGNNIVGMSINDFIRENEPNDGGFWRRLPADEREGKQNRYYQVKSDGTLNKNMRIETTAGGGFDKGKFFIIYKGCLGVEEGDDFAEGRIHISKRTIPGVYGDPSPADGSGTGIDGEGEDQNITCEVRWNNPLTWIMCPIFNGMADLTDWMFKSLIEPFLYVSPVNTDPSEPAFQAWSSFRVYANILLIVAMLVIVMGQALGGGLVDAYTAKKVLPKILAAAILINLSVYAINLMIDITNIIGKGIGNLIYAPFKSTMGSFDLGLGQGGLAAAAGVGGVVAGAGAITSFVGAATVGLGSVAPFIGLFMILPAAIAIMGVFATIVIRQGLILFLIISSPIAFCLYALPNGEQYFKKWWDLLFKTLMMYPIIVIIFCMADVLSITVLKASGNGGTVSGGVAAIVAFVLQFLPLFLIPFAFKLAGGAVASIYGAISSTGKKGLEGIKGSEHNPYSLRNSVRRNYKKAGVKTRDTWSDDVNNDNAGFWRRQRGRLAGMGNQRYDAAMLNKEEKEIQDNTTATGADDMRFAAGGFVVRKGEATRSRVKLIDPKTGKAGSTYTDKGHVDNTKDRYFNSKGQEITRGFYKKAKSTLGNDIPAIGQSLEYAVRKFENDDDIDNYWQGFTQAAVDMNMSDWEGLGTHNAATYGAKGQHIGLNKSSPKLQRDKATGRVTGVELKDLRTDAAAHKGAVDWLRRNQQQYPQSMQSDETLRTQAHWQKVLEDRIIQDQLTGAGPSQDDLDHLASIYENTDGQTQVMSTLAAANVTGDPSVSASGATPAAQEVLTAMKREQRLELGGYNARDGSRQVSIKGQTGPGPGGAGGVAPIPVGSVVLSQGGAPTVADTSGIKPTPGRFSR